MAATIEPRVSVVMPVYNGERFIAGAIRSMLGQSYRNWDLTVGDNRSTDRTATIASEFAAADPRIRVHTYSEHVNVVESHNTAFTLISDEAKYCKALGADDLEFPNSIEEMVRIAEDNPSVGIVCSYVLNGPRVNGLRLPYPSACVPGRDVVRNRLLHGFTGFGGPSTTLIRADLVRKNRPFYNPRNYAGDVEAYLDILMHHDLGFVHQVLTYMRSGEDSRTTSYLSRVDADPAAYLHEVKKFGPLVLSATEYRSCVRRVERNYYRMLGRALLPPRNREFWAYHLGHFREQGYPPRYWRIALHALLRILDALGNPKRTIESLTHSLFAHGGSR